MWQAWFTMLLTMSNGRFFMTWRDMDGINTGIQ